MVNAIRLQNELEFITANRDKWDQTVWSEVNSCGTTGCVAGWTVLHARNVPVTSETYTDIDGKTYTDYFYVEEPDWWDEAAEILDLSSDQAERLSADCNSLKDLWRIAHEITQGAIAVPDNL